MAKLYLDVLNTENASTTESIGLSKIKWVEEEY